MAHSRRIQEEKLIVKVLYELDKARAIGGSKTLYDANREVYGLLRYGVKVKPDVGEQNITVWLIDWKTPENNEFAIAEEVRSLVLMTSAPTSCFMSTGSRSVCWSLSVRSSR